jgi:hypothetical protein
MVINKSIKLKNIKRPIVINPLTGVFISDWIGDEAGGDSDCDCDSNCDSDCDCDSYGNSSCDSVITLSEFSIYT